MRIIKVQLGQSLLDIALQYCGDIAAALDIAALNNLPLCDQLAPNTELQVPDIVNKKVVNHFIEHNHSPASYIIAQP